MKQIFSLIALLAALSGWSQTTGHISGTVTDGDAKTVESATITLLHARDSSLAKLTTADKNGHFSFEHLTAGRYLVSASAVGHATSYSASFDIDATHSDIQLPVMNLKPQSKSMAGVVVTAKKPLIEHRIDRTVVNVDASITNVGTTAMDVLEKSPGIIVDKDGNISLKGKDGVLVLVDGRPTQLSGTDLANLLKSMNSNQLDQIEIMTNPPARFDASGNAGVINIKLKKNKLMGYNGSANVGYTQGRYASFNQGLNMNYRSGKVNLFANLSHSNDNRINRLHISRNLRNENTKELENYFDQTARMKNENKSFSARLGMDYSASKNTTLGFSLSGFSNPGHFTNNNLTLIYDPAMNLQNQTKAFVDYDQSWKNYSANLNFRTVLDTTGKEISGDFDYIRYNSRNDQLLVNSYFDAGDARLAPSDSLIGALPQEISIYSGRVDYVQPLKKGAKFEAGLKSSIVKTYNDARYDSLQNGALVHDFGRSNYFIYQEQINAAYVNLNGQLSKKLGAQLGLRLENTHAKGNQVTTGQKFERNYTQLFPTLYLEYKADDKNVIGLNYGRRIRRPSYESLNPFIKFLDRYTYSQGNPNLKPEFSQSVELSHTYGNFITTTLNYSYTKDIISGLIQQKGQQAYANKGNLANQRIYGVEVNINKPIFKWWTTNFYINVFHNHYAGIVDGANIAVGSTMVMLNGSEQFTFAKTWSAEISGFYRSGGVQGVIAQDPLGMLSLGLGKQILKKKGTVRLSVRDLLNTMSSHGVSRYGNVDANFVEKREARVVSLGFSYRFSKGKVGSQRKRASSADDEQNRVGH